VVTFVVDPNPHIFLGDSESYLYTAATGWVPPDRSFLYGWGIGLLCSFGRSLAPLLLVQALMGVAAGLVLAHLLHAYLGCSRWNASLGALLFILDPMQLYYQHAIMTESAAMLMLALALWGLMAYGTSERLSTLLATSALFVLLVLIRQAYLPVSVALLLIAPLLRRSPRSQSGTDLNVAWRGALGGRVVSVICGLGLFVALLALYVQALAAWKHIAPQFSRSDGLFLVSYYAPLLERNDIADVGLREVVFAPSPFPLSDRTSMQQQLFLQKGLVDRLRGLADGNELAANAIARRLAMTAVAHHPLRLLALAAATFGDFWKPARIRASLYNALGLDRDLSDHLLAFMRQQFSLSITREYQRQGGFSQNLVEKTWLLHYWRLIVPLLLGVAGARAATRREVSLAIAGFAVVVTLGSLCFVIPMDVRFLHPGSWFAAMAIAVAIDRGGRVQGS
jgi:hypothetical protein